jgi:glycosyltransferase involved in cell wall biosynthesis
MGATEKPAISAIVPVYNRAGTIGRALDSIAAQTRPADEVIVVDDGSTDGLGEVVARDYPDVTVIRQDNAGVSAARNRGVAAATGEWIALLDSDDEWRPTKLERQSQALAGNPGFHLCHTNEIWIRNGRRVNEGKRHKKSGGHIFRKCLPLCVISPSSVVIRRELLAELGGFDESLPVCEDYDLWLRICARHPVLFVEEALTIKYGGHDDQLSRRFSGMDRFRILAIDKVLDEDVLGDADREAAVGTLLEKAAVYLGGAEKRGKLEDAARYEALRHKYDGR